jgi:hypothetical protein
MDACYFLTISTAKFCDGVCALRRDLSECNNGSGRLLRPMPDPNFALFYNPNVAPLGGGLKQR